MKIEIKHRKTNEVLFSHECEKNNIRITLQEAVEADTDLSGAALTGQILAHCNLDRARLAGANLNGADLSNCLLIEADLSGADCYQCNFDNSNLTRAKLIRTDLSEAVFVGTNLQYADLTDATGDDIVVQEVNTANAILPACFPTESERAAPGY